MNQVTRQQVKKVKLESLGEPETKSQPSPRKHESNPVPSPPDWITGEYI